MGAQEAENAPDSAKDGDKIAGGGVRESANRRCKTLQATRGTEAEAPAHQQRKVEGGGVNEHPFSDLLLPANVDAAHPAAHEEMGERPLQHLTPLAQQPLPPLAPDSAATAVDRLLRVPLALPRPAARFGSLT